MNYIGAIIDIIKSHCSVINYDRDGAKALRENRRHLWDNDQSVPCLFFVVETLDCVHQSTFSTPGAPGNLSGLGGPQRIAPLDGHHYPV